MAKQKLNEISMEANHILEVLKTSKEKLDKLSRQLAEVTKEKCESEKQYNIEMAKELERARQEKVPATLIKDIVKTRLAEKLFEMRILEAKETYILNILRNERSNIEILRTVLSYKKEEMKDL